MALVAALQAASLGVRLWFEWVQSDQNPSDPLSRLGLDDPAVRAQLEAGTWQALQPTVPWEEVLRTPAALLQRWRVKAPGSVGGGVEPAAADRLAEPPQAPKYNS